MNENNHNRSYSAKSPSVGEFRGSRIYFLGIGGIGMSALARYFNAKGYQVAGYDRTPTPLTKRLTEEGIYVTYDDSVSALLPLSCGEEAGGKILGWEVVVTPAIPEDHPQLVYFRKNNFTICKRAQVLGNITRQQTGICIAGTHGKTTTSTITAHLLYQSHVSCSAFLGGIANNYQTNLLLSKDSNLVVIEADEYDRSFHQLSPFMAVITSMDADHLDIYETPEAFYESFEHFASLIRPGGVLILRKGIELNPKLRKGVKLYTYSLNDGGDFHAENIRHEKDRIYFDFVAPTERINDLYLSIPILINVENSIAAIALAWLNGVTKEEIRTGISSFSGIYRRFNVVFKSNKVVYMDDYAHHPSELRASIRSIKELYPGRKITGVFQPHLYSRTRDFADDFSEALSQLDELILLDIYPAREKPIEGITSEFLFNKVKMSDKALCSKENLLPLLGKKDLDVLVTFGAGDIDQLVPKIKDQLKADK